MCCWSWGVLVQVGYARSLCKSRTSSYESFQSPAALFRSGSRTIRASLPRRSIGCTESTGHQGQDFENSFPQLYESLAGEPLRATIATSRLRPHSLLTTPGNQSRWYVEALLVRTSSDTSKYRPHATCDSAKTPPAEQHHSDHVCSHLQVRYAATEIESAKSARARGSYLRVSFKNTRETAQAINGWKVTRALQYLENVKGHVEAVPMRRYAGSTGRTAQGT